MNKSIHVLGIGGSGASAIAAIAQAQGFKVTGCDKEPHNEFTKDFSKDQLLTGHSAVHIKDETELLVVTPAIFSLDPDNEELKAAKDKNIPILTWQEFMGEYLEKDKFMIAVCGTHGKSTTTAMIGLLLEDAGMDPTVELGAIVPKWGKNHRVGKSKYFVTEADEFNDNFLVSHPNITVITSVEYDHPEYFSDFESYKRSFQKFLNQTTDHIVGDLSNPGVKEVTSDHQSVIDYSVSLVDFELKIPGKFNVFNASAVFQVGKLLDIPESVIKKSLQNFKGIGGRFELIGEVNGAKIYSDFGHHPTELRVTFEAARDKFPDKKIWVVFQPHMFSRTKALFNDFVEVLKNAPVDGIAVFDIFPSREVDTGLVNSQQLVEAVNNKNKVEYSDSWDKYQSGIKKYIGSNDILIFIGAGNTNKWAKELVGKS